MVVEWPSNTFRATWHMSWSNGSLSISANWLAVIGGVESALARVSTLDMPFDDFVAEWAELIGLLATRLERLNLSPELEGVERFYKLARITATTKRGLLYRG